MLSPKVFPAAAPAWPMAVAAYCAGTGGLGSWAVALKNAGAANIKDAARYFSRNFDSPCGCGKRFVPARATNEDPNHTPHGLSESPGMLGFWQVLSSPFAAALCYDFLQKRSIFVPCADGAHFRLKRIRPAISDRQQRRG